jgi:hypothetical protein
VAGIARPPQGWPTLPDRSCGLSAAGPSIHFASNLLEIFGGGLAQALRLMLGEANVRRLRVALGERRRLIAAPAILRNDGADAYEAITGATVSLWEGERGDVMSLMFVAVAEGRLLAREAAARLPEFLRQHRRQFSKFGPLSLDAPIFADSATTLGDTITTGLWQ